jgi:large subunit ribosomal protein L22
MSETVKLTRKEKIAQGLPKPPKRKKAYAMELADKRAAETRVSLNNYRSSARKARLVIDMIRGMEVFHALNTLKFTARRTAPAVAKLLKAAISSFEEKNEGERVDVGTHFIKEARVDEGRTLKRIQPAPQGRAHQIRKRYCHIILVIEPREEAAE